MNKKLPSYLLEIKTNLQILAFIGIFSILFIIIYTPFTYSPWFKSNDANHGIQFIYSVITIIGGLLITTFTRIILHFISRKNEITYLQYVFWNISEIFLVALTYTAFTKFILHDSREFLDICRRAILFIPLLLLIPFTVSHLYLALKEKDKKLKKIASAADFPLISAKATETDEIVNFYDEKDTLKLSVKKEFIYYVESADNYVNIFYKKNGKITRFILRNTMKHVEEMLQKYGFARCHRSYIINLQKVQMVKKERDGFVIALDVEEIADIPISKTYTNDIVGIFAQ